MKLKYNASNKRLTMSDFLLVSVEKNVSKILVEIHGDLKTFTTVICAEEASDASDIVFSSLYASVDYIAQDQSMVLHEHEFDIIEILDLIGQQKKITVDEIGVEDLLLATKLALDKNHQFYWLDYEK